MSTTPKIRDRPIAAESIAVRAYHKWLARCEAADHQLVDWLEAEAELEAHSVLSGQAVDDLDHPSRLLAERLLIDRFQAAVCACAGVMAVSASLDEAASKLIQTLCEIFDWCAVAIWVIDPAADALRCCGYRNSPNSEFHSLGIDSALSRCVFVKRERVESHGVIAFPIINEEETIGVLEICRREDDPFDAGLIEMVGSLCRQIGQFIERRTVEETLREQRYDRQIGREIQQGLLPSAIFQVPGFEIAGRSVAAKDVGGDCYDFIPLPENHLGILVADASGHGIGAALLTGQTRAYLRALALTSANIALLLGLTNTRLTADSVSDHFVTSILLRLEPRSRSLCYSSAGHVPCYILDPFGQTKAVLRSTGLPLGIDPGSDFPSSEEITLESGDLVLLLTDGIMEAVSPNNEPFGEERILAVVRRHLQQPSETILTALFDVVRRFCCNEIFDDLTAVIIKCEGRSLNKFSAESPSSPSLFRRERTNGTNKNSAGT